ncbi:MAG: hypothetical protein JSV73_07695 [Flavobacteriaceae bacterium]|nr:MAG: hypothetical protein JSV73_07695 [Flavobacteriaceae bacterium]
MEAKPANKKVRSRIVLRGAMLFFGVLALIGSGLIIYLNIQKNDISKELLSRVNKELVGDFSVEYIALGSLWSYPDLKVTLRNLRFDAPEKKGFYSGKRLILGVKSAAFKVNLSEVLSNQIVINDLFIRDVRLIIERDSTGEMVISEGFTPKAKERKEKSEGSGLYLKIPNIHLEDLRVEIIDRQKELIIPFESPMIKGDFQLGNDKIKGKASVQMSPINLPYIQELYLNKIPLNLSANYVVDLNDKRVLLSDAELNMEKEKYSLMYDYWYNDDPEMNFELSSMDQGINLSTFFVEKNDSLSENDRIKLLGIGHFDTKLSWDPNSSAPFFEALTADFSIEGRDLKVYGIDLDKLIDKFKRSQEFNLADAGAVMFAGPAGLAVTKGSDFASLAFMKAGDSTNVTHFLADWNLTQGKLSTGDVAMSTKNNLVSTDGWYSVQKDSLDFKINVLDKRGCELIGQRIYGKASKPEYGKVKILKTFFGPVTNFFRNIGLAKCDTIYAGKVLHPSKVKSQEN